MRMLVTGGCGFIGSHLVEALIERGGAVTVLDDLSSGSKKNLASVLDDSDIEFLRGDCGNSVMAQRAVKNADVVFHFAASPEVRLELSNPKECYERNIKATFALLERIRKSRVESIVFASSSTVYGDAAQIPTPEDYGPLLPISVYGASKLACEAMVSSYCSSFKKRGVILRLANIVGPRSLHGVVYDFLQKLRADSSELQILGDGKQTKSYLYIDDCIKGIMKAFECSPSERTAIFNIGSEDMISVSEIAKTVVKELGLEGVKLRFSGGVDGGRGWVGDVKTMMLSIEKLKALGWKPKLSSREALTKLVRFLKEIKLGS